LNEKVMISHLIGQVEQLTSPNEPKPHAAVTVFGLAVGRRQMPEQFTGEQ
jgi:hypothetical protein